MPVPELPVPESMEELDQRKENAALQSERYAKRVRLQEMRERFERTFSTWIPFSEGELTMAVDGLTTRENRVLSKVSDNTLALTEAYYGAAQGYYEQASKHILELNDAKNFEADLQPSVDRIKSTPEILGTLADYLEAKQSLEGLKWLQKRGTRKSTGKMPREKEREEIIERLGRKPDDELTSLWHKAALCAAVRAGFWKTEIQNAVNSNELLAGAIKEDLTRRPE